MTAAEKEEIWKRWARMRVCNVCSKRFQSIWEVRKHKEKHHSYSVTCTSIECLKQKACVIALIADKNVNR